MCRAHDILSRVHDILSRAYDTISFAHYLLSRAQDILPHANKILCWRTRYYIVLTTNRNSTCPKNITLNKHVYSLKIKKKPKTTKIYQKKNQRKIK